MKVKIEIDTRTFVRFWLVVISFAAIAFVIISAQAALIILATALFLAIALNPLVSRLARVIPGKSRVLSTALAYVAVVIFLGAFIFLVIPPIVQQTAKLVETVPSLVNNATTQYKGLNQIIAHYQLQPQVDSALNSIKSGATSLAANFGKNIIASLGSVFAAIAATILVLVLAFFMLVEGPSWLQLLWASYGDKARMKYHRTILGKMYGVVTSYVNGQLLVSTLDGAFAGLAVFVLSLIFHVPANFAIPTAAIMFIFSLIPMFGALLGAVLVALILAFNDPVAGIIFFLYVIVYQQIEGSYISPKIQSKKLDLSALLILASVTVGIYLFGIAGGIISIPIAGIGKIFVEEYIEYRKQKHGANPVDEPKKVVSIES
jgi:predicted PurR-regulated permease PerM